MAEHMLHLLDATGNYIETLGQIETLDIAYAANDEGVLSLVLPPRYNPVLFRRDCRIDHTRTLAGIATRDVWLVRAARHGLDDRGASRISVTAFDPKTLLRRRIVVGADEISGPADDLMKELVTENFVATGDADRNVTLLAVAASSGDAPSVTLDVGNRIVLDALRDLADASAAAGTYLAFDIVVLSDGTFEFRTFTQARGRDLRDNLTLSVERGTLAEVEVNNDWVEEVTAVYLRAGTTGDATASTTAVDADAVALSPFGRIEQYVYASGDTALQSEADAALYAARAREQFTGRFVDQMFCRYGVDLAFGDLVRAEHEGTLYDCRVEPVRVAVDGSGRETIDVRLKNIT